MPSIKYLGPSGDDNDILTRIRLQSEVSGDITPATVDSQITSSLTPKADATYLSNRASQYVTSDVLTSKSSTLVPKLPINEANSPALLHYGAIPLNTIYPNQYYRAGGKGWRKVGEWNSANLSLATGHYEPTNEQQIGSFTVAGPNYSWYPIFLGFFTIGLGKGEICIKQGTRYMARSAGGNDSNAWFTCNLCPTSPTPYTGSVTFTVTRRAFFSPGSTNISSIFQFCCLAIPA